MSFSRVLIAAIIILCSLNCFAVCGDEAMVAVAAVYNLDVEDLASAELSSGELSVATPTKSYVVSVDTETCEILKICKGAESNGEICYDQESAARHK